MQAREVASIECEDEQACASLWARTVAYVSTHSATRIGFADENHVETKPPLESGVVYLWASRTPSPTNEHHARIRIKALCRGMYAMDGGPGWQYARCAREIETLERQYGEFVLTPRTGSTNDPA
ncbi:hypothetical protein [Caballeronia sp. BR00000012568055]|uniref:hypothetical protein n=1 Tax=Caballeronia sp. BR00000012568055 TaxID=2918761 RepID=UPI0023F70717|nr:hypothetical protein [Caballeronia sp. BR00000012568055]